MQPAATIVFLTTHTCVKFGEGMEQKIKERQSKYVTPGQ